MHCASEQRRPPGPQRKVVSGHDFQSEWSWILEHADVSVNFTSLKRRCISLYADWLIEYLPVVLWHCLLSVRSSIQLIKKLSNEVLASLSVWSEVQVVCIWSSWCHCYPIIYCFIKIQIGLTFLVPAYPGCLEHRGVCLFNWLNTCVKLSAGQCTCSVGYLVVLFSVKWKIPSRHRTWCCRRGTLGTRQYVELTSWRQMTNYRCLANIHTVFAQA